MVGHMHDSYDTTDPLGMLMAEWSQVAIWFWALLIAAGLLTWFQTPYGVVMAAAAVGFPLIKLGPTLLVTANELRKELRRQSEAPEDDSTSPL